VLHLDLGGPPRRLTVESFERSWSALLPNTDPVIWVGVLRQCVVPPVDAKEWMEAHNLNTRVLWPEETIRSRSMVPPAAPPAEPPAASPAESLSTASPAAAPSPGDEHPAPLPPKLERGLDRERDEVARAVLRERKWGCEPKPGELWLLTPTQVKGLWALSGEVADRCPVQDKNTSDARRRKAMRAAFTRVTGS
jgi:hypothetical protein